MLYVLLDGIAPPTTEPPTTPTEYEDTTEQTTKPFSRSDGGQGRKQVIVKEPLSTGVIIGIILAVIVMAILISAGIVMYMKKRKSGLHSTGQNRYPNNRQNYIVEVEMNRRKR